MAKGLVVATLAVAVLAFVAYPIFLPVPDDVADSPWTLKIATVVLRFVSGIFFIQRALLEKLPRAF